VEVEANPHACGILTWRRSAHAHPHLSAVCILMRILTWWQSASSCAFSLDNGLRASPRDRLLYLEEIGTRRTSTKKLEQDVCRRGTWRRLYLSALVHVSSSLFDLTRGATTSLECPSLCILLLS